MSDPVDTSKVDKYAAIQSALSELQSAESSLNMYPDPQECANCGIAMVGRNLYLSQTDSNATHAIEHMRAAFQLMSMAFGAQEDLKIQVWRLVEQLNNLGERPKVKTWLDEPMEGDDP